MPTYLVTGGAGFIDSAHCTYGLPVVVTNWSTNDRPHHFPERLIPLTIRKALHQGIAP